MLKLNAITRDILDAADVKENTTIRVNSRDITRKELVSAGRLVVSEHFGHLLNRNPNADYKYNSQLSEVGADYGTLQRKFTEKKLLFCANHIAKLMGREPLATFDDFRSNANSYGKDPLFIRMLAEIDQEVLNPIFFDVIDAVGMGLMQWEPVGFGQTKEITVRSNDVFLFEDGSWGSGHSTSKNYMYAKTITLNPKMYTANATIKWYQDVVAGDAGRYYAAIMLGLYNKIYAKTISAMNTAIEAGTHIPSGLTSDTYDTANWIKITDLVAAANGIGVNDLMAIGTRASLSALLPVDGTGGAITGLQYGLGEAWFYNGYLPKAAGVDLFPVAPVIVPGTQNSTLQTIDTGDNIYILGKGQYRPLYGAYFEGSPITLTATPSGGNGSAMGTADFTIDINVGATFDIQPVFASKVGVIKSAYAGG